MQRPFNEKQKVEFRKNRLEESKTMTQPRILLLTVVLIALLSLTGCGSLTPAPSAEPTSWYFDFDKTVDAAWSTRTTYEVANGRVLGLFNNRNRKFRPNTRLKIEGLPPDRDVHLEFDLYLVGTWDSGGDLADLWTLTVQGGPTLIELTRFPNRFMDKEQKMPIDNDGFVVVYNKPRAYWIEHQSLTIATEHIRDGRLVLLFDGRVTGRKTEYWALDNVTVSTRP